MKRTAIYAIGIMSLAIAATAGTAIAQSGDRDPQHILSFKRAFSEAEKVALEECNNTPNCIAYGAGPTCTSGNRHKWECPIHIVTGTPGDQATQQDCHRNVQLLIKRFTGRKLFFRFISSYTCAPNTEHPGF